MFFVFRFKALTFIVKVKILELRELLVSLVLREILRPRPGFFLQVDHCRFRLGQYDAITQECDNAIMSY